MSEDTPAANRVTFVTIDEGRHGQRLDNFLFTHLKGVPKSRVYRIIRSGEVRINKGAPSRPPGWPVVMWCVFRPFEPVNPPRRRR